MVGLINGIDRQESYVFKGPWKNSKWCLLAFTSLEKKTVILKSLVVPLMLEFCLARLVDRLKYFPINQCLLLASHLYLLLSAALYVPFPFFAFLSFIGSSPSSFLTESLFCPSLFFSYLGAVKASGRYRAIQFYIQEVPLKNVVNLTPLARVCKCNHSLSL